MSDWARPLVAGLVATVVVALLAALTSRAAPDKAGWRHLKPSAMHWTGVLLGTALVLLMAYVRLFVGSTRADAAQQMTILTWLIVAFALGTVIVAAAMAALRRRAIRWRGSKLVWRTAGAEQQAELATIRAVSHDRLGYAVLHFAGGRRLRIDPYARGGQALIEAAHDAVIGSEEGTRDHD